MVMAAWANGLWQAYDIRNQANDQSQVVYSVALLSDVRWPPRPLPIHPYAHPPPTSSIPSAAQKGTVIVYHSKKMQIVRGSGNKV